MCNTNKPYQHQGVLFGFFLKISHKKKEETERLESSIVSKEDSTTFTYVKRRINDKHNKEISDNYRTGRTPWS